MRDCDIHVVGECFKKPQQASFNWKITHVTRLHTVYIVAIVSLKLKVYHSHPYSGLNPSSDQLFRVR
jgi:hypothetical protein